jgi:hypothetical protein
MCPSREYLGCDFRERLIGGEGVRAHAGQGFTQADS